MKHMKTLTSTILLFLKNLYPLNLSGPYEQGTFSYLQAMQQIS